jgi:hypothetical protein
LFYREYARDARRAADAPTGLLPGRQPGWGEIVDGAVMPKPPTDTWPPLVDLTSRSLLDVISGGDDALARAARRVIQALDDPDGIISAFQSFASSPAVDG